MEWKWPCAKTIAASINSQFSTIIYTKNNFSRVFCGPRLNWATLATFSKSLNGPGEVWREMKKYFCLFTEMHATTAFDIVTHSFGEHHLVESPLTAHNANEHLLQYFNLKKSYLETELQQPHYIDTSSADINECEPSNDCMQKCANSIGSYNCSCDDFFKPDPTDWRKCSRKFFFFGLFLPRRRVTYNLYIKPNLLDYSPIVIPKQFAIVFRQNSLIWPRLTRILRRSVSSRDNIKEFKKPGRGAEDIVD